MKEILKLLEQQEKILNHKKHIVNNFPLNVIVFLHLEHIVDNTPEMYYKNTFIVQGTHFSLENNSICLHGKKYAVKLWDTDLDDNLMCGVLSIIEWQIMKRIDFPPTMNWYYKSTDYPDLINILK